MNNVDESTDWRKLRDFAGVDVEKSFVLSWKIEAGTLIVDIDLFLTPDHPFFEKPRPAEKICIRPALIEFPYCDSVSTSVADPEAKTDEIVGNLGHGAISGFCREKNGNYRIDGEFGSVTINAERPVMRLRNLV